VGSSGRSLKSIEPLVVENGSSRKGVGVGCSVPAGKGADVGEPSSDEHAAASKTKTERADQKMAARRDRGIFSKKASSGTLGYLTVVTSSYEQLPNMDGIQVV
jgi:hypothetical protein